MKEERKRILSMVQEGKLTVDEALILIEELEKSSKVMEEKHEKLVKDLSTYVQFEEGKKEKNTHDQFQSTKDRIFDFVDTAVKKLKDLDLDLHFGKHLDLSHIFQQTDANVKQMDIDIANGNVTVIPWDQKDIRVECTAQVYRFDTMEEAKSHFLKEVSFEVEGDILRFSTRQKWIKLETVIYVPDKEYDKADIRLFNGGIGGANLNVKQFKMKTANGKIALDNMIGERVEVETANGAIRLNQCKIDEIDAETLNGAILVDGDFRKAELQSFNGHIHCKLDGLRCERLEAKTTTGGIDLDVPEYMAVNGKLKSNLGSFTVDLEGIQILEEKNEFMQKTLSFKSIKDAQSSVHVLADTKTGSIVIRKA